MSLKKKSTNSSKKNASIPEIRPQNRVENITSTKSEHVRIRSDSPKLSSKKDNAHRSNGAQRLKSLIKFNEQLRIWCQAVQQRICFEKDCLQFHQEHKSYYSRKIEKTKARFDEFKKKKLCLLELKDKREQVQRNLKNKQDEKKVKSLSFQIQVLTNKIEFDRMLEDVQQNHHPKLERYQKMEQEYQLTISQYLQSIQEHTVLLKQKQSQYFFELALFNRRN